MIQLAKGLSISIKQNNRRSNKEKKKEAKRVKGYCQKMKRTIVDDKFSNHSNKNNGNDCKPRCVHIFNYHVAMALFHNNRDVQKADVRSFFHELHAIFITLVPKVLFYKGEKIQAYQIDYNFVRFYGIFLSKRLSMIFDNLLACSGCSQLNVYKGREGD